MKLKNSIVLYSSIVAFIFTSCDYRPIEDMPMIVGLAIDPAEEGYQLTAKVIIPSTASGGQGLSQQVFVQSSGKTMFDAARDFIMKEGQKVFWGQLNMVIINSSIVDKDITQVLDFMLRDNEIRETLWLLVAKEETKAENILRASFSENRVRFYISDAMQNVDSVGKYDESDLLKFKNELMHATGKEPVLPLISIEKSLGEDKIIVNGICLFKDKKRIGHLDGKETQRYRILTGKTPGLYIIDYKTEVGESQITLEVSNVKNKSIIKKDDSTYDVTIETDITAVIGEVVNNNIRISTEEDRDQFIKEAEKQLDEDLKDLVNKIQKEYSSDIFGIGEKVKNRYPKDYKRIEKDWNTVFGTLDIKVKSKVNLTGSALFKQPFYKDE